MAIEIVRWVHQSTALSFNSWVCGDIFTIKVKKKIHPQILEWVAVPFSMGSSQPMEWTQVSLIAGRFFTIWATREAPQIKRVSLKSSKNSLHNNTIFCGEIQGVSAKTQEQ